MGFNALRRDAHVGLDALLPVLDFIFSEFVLDIEHADLAASLPRVLE